MTEVKNLSIIEKSTIQLWIINVVKYSRGVFANERKMTSFISNAPNRKIVLDIYLKFNKIAAQYLLRNNADKNKS